MGITRRGPHEHGAMQGTGRSDSRFEGRLRVRRCWDGGPIEADEEVIVRFSSDGSALTVEVEAPFHGDPAPPSPAGRADGLWEFEVVELFLVGSAERYFELELGPHGHYLALRLEGRRCPVNRDVRVEYRAVRSGERWTGAARVALEHLYLPIESVNAFVMHGLGARRRHLAAYALGGSEPDFHRIGDYPRFDADTTSD